MPSQKLARAPRRPLEPALLSLLLQSLAESAFGAARLSLPAQGLDTVLAGFAALAMAESDEMSFCASPSNLEQLSSTKAAVVLLNRDLLSQAPSTSALLVAVEDAYLAMAYLLQAWVEYSQEHAAAAPAAQLHASARVHPSVVVEQGAVIGEGAVIGAFCFVGAGVLIGAGTRLHPRVSVLAGCEIGANCLVHSGAVIGADGFGFARDPRLGGAGVKIPQIARVVLMDEVEVGANSTIDRGALTDTVIGRGVKIDNLVQIAHGVRIGEHTALAGCAGVAGSATIGAHCFIGGGAVVLGHLSVCDRVTVSAGSVVMSSISQPGQYTGLMPLDTHARWQKNAAVVRRLSELRDEVRELKKS